ncbi:MAG: hypothetical protein P8074_09960 [Anaerolineales bacterium]|jgi:hypothetical protein
MKDPQNSIPPSGQEKSTQMLEAAVEDALVTMEVLTPPADLARNVMTQVRSTPQMPGFRLTWLDGSLSAFVALMLLLIVLLGSALPPELVLYLRQELLYWSMRIQLDPLTPLLVLGASALLVAGSLLLVAMLVRYLLRRERMAV